MIDASLDRADIEDTLAAIARQADYLDVTWHALDAEPRAHRASVAEACSALLTGRAAAVKLSYRVADAAWCDTVMPAGKHYRWLRVRRTLAGWLLGRD